MARILTIMVMALASVSFLTAGSASAKDKREKSERLTVRAADTVSYFATDSAFETMWNLADDAKAMVVIPRSLRGGFVFGASGGNAAMLARNKDGSWTQPTFLTMGSISFGFQAGGEASEIVLLVMTNRGMQHLLSTSVKLGADVTLAAGPIGAGAKVQTTDILAFSRSRGLYGGVSLEGAVLKTRHSWNKAYYNAEVSPADIIYREQAYNPTSAVLQSAVHALAKREKTVPTLATVRNANEARVGNNLEMQQIESDTPLYEMPSFQQMGGQPEPQTPNSDSIVYEDDAAWGAPVKRDPSASPQQ